MPETTGARVITVRCPTHNTDFEVDLGERIVCPAGPHSLAQRFPNEEFWEYCCDCQRFWPSQINYGGQSDQQCPVCSRQIARHYLCNNCKLVSIESDDPTVKRKRYTFTDERGITPACPACYGVESGTLRRHECLETGATFITARDVCPFCEKPTTKEKKIESVEANLHDAVKVKSSPAKVNSLVVNKTDRVFAKASIGTCSQCQTVNRTTDQFCRSCGSQLKPQIEPQASFSNREVMGATQPTEGFAVGKSKTLSLKPILAVGGAIALLGILITIAGLSSSGNSIEKRLDKAITARNIFGPSTDNAYDLYNQLRNSGAREETLSHYREKLLPLLTNPPFQIIRELMVPGSDEPTSTAWQSAAQSLRWATELKPGDSSLLSRTIYCEGRVAYLAHMEDQAVEAWSRASETDKTWPLPVNGLGLIYFSRKNYAAARSHYSEAIRRDPNWAYPHNNLGTVFHYEKNDSAAKSHYRKAVELAPRWARPHAWLGEIALKEGDYSTAVSEFEAVLNPNATGTKNMNLQKIQQMLEKARQKMAVSYE